MPFTLPADPSDGNIAPASWGDDVRAALSYLANPPSCRVYNSATINVADNALVYPTFNSERWDTDNMHDTVTNPGRITFNTAGLYVVTAGAVFGGRTDYKNSQVGIRLNGGSMIAIQDTVGSTVTDSYEADASCVTVWKFAAGDYIEMRVYQRNVAAATVVIVSRNYETPEFGATWIGLG